MWPHAYMVQLCDRIRQFSQRQADIYAGHGMMWEQDRLYLRQKLHEVTDGAKQDGVRREAVREITLRVPCGILAGGTEFVDCPGETFIMVFMTTVK